MARLKPAAVAALLCASLLPADGLKIKNIKPGANPPQYASFSQPLSQSQQIEHAANRLTLGARPQDVALIHRIGLKKWIDQQLHPDSIPENPELLRRLAAYPTLAMSIHDTYVDYPPPRLIVAFAKGRATLPADPQARAVIVRLANRYLQKRGESNAAASDPTEDSALDLRMSLSAILSPQQIESLQSGTPDEKRQVLEAIPPEKGPDFAWALRRPERQKLLNLAPVSLRRDLMFTMNPANVVISDLSEAKLLRGIYSNRQLAEALDDFWFNHFNVFANKGADRYLLPTYERETIRPHVFGKFYDLLLATAESPAMLFYLDNASSVAPGTARPGNAKSQRGLNENYGRELLELHTLGVDGGYAQKDVIEVARCFTGWTIANPRKGGGFEYRDRVHDQGQKVVLGHVISAGGRNDGLEVLRILAHSPATAHFISLKIAQRFVADDPPPSLVNRMAKDFLKSDGDLRELMRTMLSSPEFWSQGAARAKVKSPFEMVVSAVRAANAQVTSAYALENVLQRLGEPLYRKIEPTGYSNENAEWVSSSALLERMNFSLALAHNRIPGVQVDPSQQPIALMLGSPEFQRH